MFIDWLTDSLVCVRASARMNPRALPFMHSRVQLHIFYSRKVEVSIYKLKYNTLKVHLGIIKSQNTSCYKIWLILI
jgi:hypothetical protein